VLWFQEAGLGSAVVFEDADNLFSHWPNLAFLFAETTEAVLQLCAAVSKTSVA